MSSPDFWVGPHDSPDTYRLVNLLGGGGEGQVWKAVLQLSEGGRTTVAVKILRPERGAEDEHEWKRFGHLLRSLADPGLVRVTDVFIGPLKHRLGQSDSQASASYVVMDYIEGPTLWEWCHENPEATASDRLRMLRMVASALDEMHSGSSTEVPVAHGDVKPGNVVVSRDGAPMLVDLGLARLTDAPGTAGRSAPYAAPELRGAGGLASCEADRYAFAVTAAQVLTGQPPPTGPDGYLDRTALETLLRSNPITGRRHALISQLLTVVDSPPEARPKRLLPWIESATDSLSQTTSGTPAVGPSPAFGPGGTVVDHGSFGQHSLARKTRRRRFKAIVGLVFTLLVGLLAGYLYLTRTPGGVGALLLPELPTSSRAIPTPSPVDEPPAVESVPAAPVGPVHLADSAPVQEGEGGVWRREAGAISGQTFGQALKMRAMCDDQSQDYWVDYNLSRDSTRFTTTVGISDSARANAKASYAVLLDGRTIESGDLTLGQAVPIDVAVDNVLRLRLQINEREDATSRNCSYGDNAPAWVVWGDPAIRPKQ